MTSQGEGHSHRVTIRIIVEIGPNPGRAPAISNSLRPFKEFCVGVVMAIPVIEAVKSDVNILLGPDEAIGESRTLLF
jgi:hypothetical protein